MHIRHLVCTDAFAGVERYITYAAVELARRGHHVDVLGGDPGRMEAALQGSGAVHLGGGGVLAVARRCAGKPRPDLVHSHMTAADAAALLARPVLRRPVVSTLHFAHGRGHSTVTRAAYRVMPALLSAEVSISQFVADAVGRPTTVIPSGLPFPDGPTEERRPVVLVVQRLEQEKDTATAIRAWAASGLASDGWELHVLGDGAERPMLTAMSEELGVDSSVRFRGQVTDVADRLRRASAFLAPTPVEGFGFAVVEAMAAGLPVVAADGGAHRETVGPASADTLFPPGDAQAAAKMLRSLADDPTRRAALGAAGRSRYEAEYTIGRHVDRLEALYERLIGR